MTDEAELQRLIGAVAGGDRAAFRALYRATSAKLLGVALRILKDRGQAEAALQETFLAVWRNAGSYDATAGRPMTWLASIARYRAIDARRKMREAPMASEDGALALEQMADPAQPLDRFEVEALRRCLRALDAEARELVVLAYCEGYSREELAERTKRPVNTIKTRLRRGLIALRLCLDDA